MYLIYSRYLFLTIFRSFYLVFSLIVGVLWLAQILRYSYFYNKGIQTHLFIKSALFILPTIIVEVLPLITVITVITAYVGLQRSNELIPLFNIGIKPKQIAKPALLIGFLITLFGLALSCQIKPHFVTLFNNNTKNITQSINENFFETQRLNKISDQLYIYIGDRQDGVLQEIIIIDLNNPKDIIFAAKASLKVSQDDNLLVKLNGAEKHFAKNDQTLAKISFEELDFEIKNLFNINTSQNLDNLNILELWNLKSSEKSNNEIASRVLWPLYNLILTVLSITILLWNCNIYIKNVILAILVVALALITYFVGIKIASTWPELVHFRYITSALLLSGFSYTLFRR